MQTMILNVDNCSSKLRNVNSLVHEISAAILKILFKTIFKTQYYLSAYFMTLLTFISGEVGER